VLSKDEEVLGDDVPSVCTYPLRSLLQPSAPTVTTPTRTIAVVRRRFNRAAIARGSAAESG
jgi:hypothetical protein